MKNFEFYRTIRLSNKKDVIKKAFSMLDDIYSSIPETKGCLECIRVEKGCCSWCCRIQTPQLFYSEFLLIWERVSKEFNNDQILYLFEKCMLNAVTSAPSKGCVFFDEKTNLCRIHNVRPYNCFLPETWVYTKHGPSKIKDILAGDFVYSHDGELHKVLSTATHIYNGKIYNIKYQGNHIDVWCTSDHKWFVDERKDKRKKINLFWKLSEDLITKKCKKNGNYLSLPLKYKINVDDIKEINVLDFIKAKKDGDRIFPFTCNSSSKSLPSQIKVDDEFLFMFGLYLSEGSSSNFSASFSMNSSEIHYLKRIEKFFNSLNIECTYPKVSHSKDLIILRVGSSLVAKLLSVLGNKGAKDKSINDSFFSLLSVSQMKKIYNSWDIGDGRKCLKNEFSTTTISEKLALQMNFILLSSGIFPRIYKHSRGDREGMSYDVHVFPSSLGEKIKMDQGTKIIANEDYFIIPVDEIDKKDYIGAVVDIQIEGSETFITSSGIVHNCRLYGITPEAEFKPRYERLKEEYKGIRDAVIKDQCNLIQTVDGSTVTMKKTKEWFLSVKKVDVMFLGIPRQMATDDFGGSYRSPHDHILLYNMPSNILNSLSGIKLYEAHQEKIDAVRQIILCMKDFFKQNEK